MIRNLILLLVFAFSIHSYGQLGGRSTYQFLNLVSSPRQAALGGKSIANVDYDVTQALYNPATINPEMHNQVSTNFTSYLGGITYGNAAYARTFSKKKEVDGESQSVSNTFHIGINYIGYGDFDGYDELGNATSSFSGNETAISIGYAKQLGKSNFYGGANIKFISSALEQYNSIGAAADLAILYSKKEKSFQATLVVRNIGTQITTYNDVRESLPLEVNLGLSQELENVPIRWHLTLENLQQWPIAFSNPSRVQTDLEGNQTQEEIGVLGEVVRHTIFGVELFPQKGFNIRLGYNFRRAEELRIEEQRNFSGLSAGFSIKLNRFRFSYTHAKYTSAANSNFFGVQIDLQ